MAECGGWNMIGHVLKVTKAPSTEIFAKSRVFRPVNYFGFLMISIRLFKNTF
jgi:hypothetical protein